MSTNKTLHARLFQALPNGKFTTQSLPGGLVTERDKKPTVALEISGTEEEILWKLVIEAATILRYRRGGFDAKGFTRLVRSVLREEECP